MLAQTPGTWLKAGGFSHSNDACRKALAACGLNPDEFGSYKEVGKSQTAARQDLRERARNKQAEKTGGSPDQHCDPCQLEPGSKYTQNCRCQESSYAKEAAESDYEFLHANGQSGHLSQDALYRAEGGRGDPCQNHPPGPGHSGTYGYDTDRARCMEHYGRSSLKGSTHEQVCRAEDSFMRGLTPGQKLGVPELREGAGRSAVVAVTAGRLKVDDRGDKLVPAQLSPEAQAKQKEFEARQKGAAGELAKEGEATNKFQGNELSEDEKIAVECIVQDWENSLAAMQNEAVAKYGPGSSKKAKKNAEEAYKAKHPPGKKWDQMTDAEKKTAVEERQKQLAGKAANQNPREAQQDPGAPTKEDCREYQANWLWQQQQPPEGSGIPPMQGQAPGTPPEPTTTVETEDENKQTF